MKDSLVIQVPSKKKIWIFIQIIFVYMMLWFRDVIGLPSVIVYLTDIIVVLIIISISAFISYAFLSNGNNS